MKKRNLFLIGVFLFSVLACRSARNEVVAKVGHDEISKDEYIQALSYEISKYSSKKFLDKAKLTELKKSVLDDLIKERVLFARSEAAKIKIDEDKFAKELVKYKSQYTESAFRRMLELRGINYDQWKEKKMRQYAIDKLVEAELLPNIKVTDKEIQNYYKKHGKEFKHGEEVHARQIVVEDQKQAEEIRQKALTDENFAGLAYEYSIAPEAKNGGDLGWFEKGIMPPAFDKVCFSIPVNSVSEVVKTEYGYHIFKVIDRKTPEMTPLKDVKDNIITKIQQEKIESEFEKWYEPIKKAAKVVVNQPLLDSIDPLKENSNESK